MSAYLNREAFDLLVARAALTNAEFANEAGISPVTLSHARNGRPLRPSTLRRIALGLTRIKTVNGLNDNDDLVMATPPKESNGRDRVGSVATEKEDERGRVRHRQ